jgi:hypothetical protein
MNRRNVGIIFHGQGATMQLGRIFDQVWTSAYASKL